MKKITALLLTAVMVTGLFAGCGAKADNAATAGAKNAGDTFTVGFDAEFPPYGYMDESGEYVGFDLDLAQAACDKLGLTLVKQPIAWDSKDMELSSGTIDCIWNGFTINGREDEYTWSVPYIDNSQVFVVASASGIASKDDLAGKNIGVQRDSSAAAALEDEENAEMTASFESVTQYDDYNTGFMDLESGAIDALAVDIGVANYQLESRGDTFIKLDEALSTEQYGIGFLKGNDALKNQIEAVVLELNADGTVKSLAEKYGIDPASICLK